MSGALWASYEVSIFDRFYVGAFKFFIDCCRLSIHLQVLYQFLHGHLRQQSVPSQGSMESFLAYDFLSGGPARQPSSGDETLHDRQAREFVELVLSAVMCVQVENHIAVEILCWTYSCL